jgi:DNA-binding NarL/FixJ family response regulator
MDTQAPLIIADPFSFTAMAAYGMIRRKELFTKPLYAIDLKNALKLIEPLQEGWILITDDFIKEANSCCIAAILEKCSTAKILLFTGQQNIFILHRWKHLGIHALIHKSASADEMKKAVLHKKVKNEAWCCSFTSKILETDSALLTGNKKVILSEKKEKFFC